MDERVAATFRGYPPAPRLRLLALRKLILETAAATEGVGEIEETLKWSEPAYLTNESRSGTTIRLGWKVSSPASYRMLFHCQTDLVDTFRTLYPEFEYEGNRAIVFGLEDDPPFDALARCIAIALTYHRTRRKENRTARGRK
jgi:hypothetical protein